MMAELATITNLSRYCQAILSLPSPKATRPRAIIVRQGEPAVHFNPDELGRLAEAAQGWTNGSSSPPEPEMLRPIVTDKPPAMKPDPGIRVAIVGWALITLLLGAALFGIGLAYDVGGTVAVGAALLTCSIGIRIGLIAAPR